jgi:hypothetical protein
MKEQSAGRAFLEHLKTPEGGEIRRHALVGGTVAALLAFFEAFRPHPAVNLESQILLVGLFVLAFVFGCGVILLAEFLLQRKNPIRLEDVGIVDGIWIYGFRDVNSEDRNFSGGSVVRITSCGLGFKIEGHAYRLADLEDAKLFARNGRLGFFKGRGQAKGTTLSFHYEGQEDYRQDTGVGRYLFAKSFPGEDELRVSGEFTGTGFDAKKVSSREVRGHRISHTATEEFDELREREALLQCLNELNNKRDEVKISFPRAGSVDGWWVDAVYEERGLGWEAVKGSILKFESVNASGRFTVTGDTYLAEELKSATDATKVEPNYHFKGHGRRLEEASREGFFYEYEGKEGRSAHGVGYYEFRRNAEELPTFEGCFLCTPPGEPNSIVFGVKIADELDVKERRVQLLEHLETCWRDVPAVIVTASRLQINPEYATHVAGGSRG